MGPRSTAPATGAGWQRRRRCPDRRASAARGSWRGPDDERIGSVLQQQATANDFIAPRRAAAPRRSGQTSLLQRLRDFLPTALPLSNEVWERRHRVMVVLVWLHAIAIPLAAWYQGDHATFGQGALDDVAHNLGFGHGFGHGLAEAAVIGLFGLLAAWRRLGRRLRLAFVCIGLLTSSAVFVHLSGGYIEVHFHYFVVVALIALYQDWIPFLVAVGYVVMQHGLFGVFDPGAVYNHAEGAVHPWQWAGVHGAFIVAECIGLFTLWRLVEDESVRRRVAQESEAQQLVAYTRELEESNRLKGEFLTTMSHELRTPMNGSLDIMMPRVDGLGVVTNLRSRPETAALPVIMVSAQGAGAATGASAADAYFPKPIDFPTLFGRIEELLARSRGASLSGPTAGATAAAGTAAGAGGSGPTGLVAFVGAKGGVGTTTVAANAAISLARGGARTVLVEATTFHGALATMLGVTPRRRMDRLPLSVPGPLDLGAVDDTLLTHVSGMRLMLGPGGLQAPPVAEGVIALLDALKQLAGSVVVDLDDAIGVFDQVTLRVAEQVWVVTRPETTGAERAEALIHLMEQWGIRPQRIRLLVNQVSPAMTMEPAEITRHTERQVGVLIPAAPDACAEATRRGVSLVELAPDLPTTRAMQTVATTMAVTARHEEAARA